MGRARWSKKWRGLRGRLARVALRLSTFPCGRDGEQYPSAIQLHGGRGAAGAAGQDRREPGLKDTVSERPQKSYSIGSEFGQNSVRIQEILSEFSRNDQIQ